MAGHHFDGALLEVSRRLAVQGNTPRTRGQADNRVCLDRHLAALICELDHDIHEMLPILDPFADNFAGDDLRVTDIVELPDFVMQVQDKAVITAPIGQVVIEVILAHDPIIIGHRIADRLGP